MSRTRHRLSRFPKYETFFSVFSPLELEFNITAASPENFSKGWWPFPNSYTFLITNRRIFYDIGPDQPGAPSRIRSIHLTDIVNCEPVINGKTGSGVNITTVDHDTIQLHFNNQQMRASVAEAFAKEMLNRARIAKENGDVFALSKAINELASGTKPKFISTPRSRGGIATQDEVSSGSQSGIIATPESGGGTATRISNDAKLKIEKPIPGGAIIVGIIAGLFFFATSLPAGAGLGGSLIIGGGAFWAGLFMAKQWLRSQGRTDTYGDTALMQASREGRREVVQELLDKEGTEVNAKTGEGKTALMWASFYGHREVVEALLGKGAEVNAKDNNGNSALMVACLNGHREIVEMLLDSGAEINAKSAEGKTALDVARTAKHADVVASLEQAGAT
jgi:hypothetical protein